MPQQPALAWRLAVVMALGPAMGFTSFTCTASDHLDTRTVIEDPRADIGDLYAWMSSDGSRLNLVMTIVGRSFSEELTYTFHVDSGGRFGRTTASTSIV